MFTMMMHRCASQCLERSAQRSTRLLSYRRRRGPRKPVAVTKKAKEKAPQIVQTSVPASKTKPAKSSGSASTTSYYWSSFLPTDTLFREKATAAAPRFALCLAVIGVLSWEETAPFSLVRIHGPSMLPTLMPDGSEIYLQSKFYWKLRVGDLVGFAHPAFPRRVSCKRVVGLPGDTVYRYGEYVHLYLQQDPERWGISDVPNDDAHGWMDASWDDKNDTATKDSKRTLVVPDNHIFVEADSPFFGLDSRHFGPLPTEYVQGKVVAKIWPLKRTNWKQRPHPIPLDKETLWAYNLYQISS